MVAIHGCATVFPDKIIAKHFEKKQLVVPSSVELNFSKALQLLTKCMPYLGVSDQVSTTYGEGKMNPLLSAYVHEIGEEKQIALGNSVSDENTLLTAYWKRWNKSFEKDGYSFYDAISEKDTTKYNYDEAER